MTDQEIAARPIGADVRDDQHDEPPPASGSNELDETDASSGDGDSGGKPELDDRMKKMYWRFGAMIATSTVAMTLTKKMRKHWRNALRSSIRKARHPPPCFNAGFDSATTEPPE